MSSGLSDAELVVLGARPLTPDDPVRVGRYRLAAVLGAGGMGRVYLGWADGRYVAVKVIRPELATSAQFRRRFAHELAAVSRLDTAFTAALVDAEPDANRPWLATQYVPGVPLEDAVEADGPLQEAAVWRLAAGVATALQGIHDAGIIHRDLKPSNVILDPDGLKVIDFGVAHAADLSQLTVTGQHVGTPSYMAPEQARTGVTGPAADIFALGGLLTFAATGKPPFGEGTTTEVLFRVVHEPPDLSGLEETDPHLRTLVEQCLQKDPKQRPNAAAVAAAVTAARAAAQWPEPLRARIAQRKALAAAAPADEPAVPDGPLTSAGDEAGLPRKPGQTPAPAPHRRRRAVMAAAAGAVVILAVSAAFAAGLLPPHQESAGSSRVSARASSSAPAAASPSAPSRSSTAGARSSPPAGASGHAPPEVGQTGTAPWAGAGGPGGAGGAGTPTITRLPGQGAPPTASSQPPGQAPAPTATGPRIAWIPGSAASSNGCEAWMNYRSDGFTQALLESWGNNCKMNYFRGPTQQFKDSRQQNGTGTLRTDFYWDGPGVYTWVCVWRDGYYKQNSCGGKYYVENGTYHAA
ncbi:serine/threonine protein kinase [Streptomyces sp. NPDC090499]|uniref:serine/threonine protein kinase n=1 Tax=Streptomyces sp. NPDC090499 TaxID=3365965 RepID=UPI0037FFBF8D